MEMMLFLLYFFCGPVQTSVIERLLWYEPIPKTWMDARKNCKSVHNGDLATATEAEVSQMYMQKFYAWIGLRRSGSEWYWHKGNGVVHKVQSYFNTPDGNKECGQAQYATAEPLDEDCENRHFFFCRYYENMSIYPYDVLIPKAKSWDEAKLYCERKNYQFISLTLHNDLHWGSSPFYVSRNFPVWIGQYQEGGSWQWSNWGENIWSPGSGPDICGFVWSQNKTWSSESCSEAFPSLCYIHNLILVQEALTWEQAILHCTTLQAPTLHPYTSYQLLSVDLQDLEFAHLQARNATTNKVWLALRFIGGSWFWSNGEVLSLPDLPLCPEPNLYCGALVVNGNSSTSKPIIEPTDCRQKLNLLCYGL